MSEALNKILAQGYVDKLPNCELCGLTENNQPAYPFLVLSHNLMVCGKCAVKMSQGKKCSCGVVNKWNAKFCMECGVKFDDTNNKNK